jgi:hypothetical protein
MGVFLEQEAGGFKGGSLKNKGSGLRVQEETVGGISRSFLNPET